MERLRPLSCAGWPGAWDKSMRLAHRWRLGVEQRLRCKYRWRLGLEKKVALHVQVALTGGAYRRRASRAGRFSRAENVRLHPCGLHRLVMDCNPLMQRRMLAS